MGRLNRLLGQLSRLSARLRAWLRAGRATRPVHMEDELLRGVVLGVAIGAAAGVLLVTPMVVGEVRSEIQAAWDADVASWRDLTDAAYQRGREDERRLAALAAEAQEVTP